MSGRLVAWLSFVGIQILLAYSVRASQGKPERNAVYHYDLAVSAVVQYGIFLVVVVAIAGVGNVRAALALRRPRSWRRAAGAAAAVLAGIVLLNALLDPILHAGREQGLTPTSWQPSHAGAFAASFAAVTLVGPFVEEAAFRGLGFSLLAPYGTPTAIAVVGLLFGLAHGLVDGLPVLVAFGAGLAWIRARTDSLYPPLLVHALFNAVALVVAVTA